MKLTQLQTILATGSFVAEPDVEMNDDGIATAGINVTPAIGTTTGSWGNQIEVHSNTRRDVTELRDFVLLAINEKIERMLMSEFVELSK